MESMENDDKIKKGPGSVNHYLPKCDNGSDMKWRSGAGMGSEE